ncbi:SET domain-containing protein-lysine N-methyltransferase [uncultured Pseudodesulfovibrio sp.]|uniref:SET domain-containing protein n=1 Tax=uncultured Pseudodesulfovibrio sp. TaxID=2035858 RepID=UPI0029C6A0B0|nr:SET domain-containing protein-lysine N-methyltransferase [uncultured Pseudodesulfovibrio sp.]
MIHPNTEVRFVNPTIGHGVFATADIPRGTIVFVKDSLDIELTEAVFNELDEHHKAVADKYSYIDENGVRILSWDNAKYVNHKCDCNIISTGYGFEIAIRDIWKNEEICDDYGLFNLEDKIPLSCGCRRCRQWLRPDDLDNHYATWDAQIVTALQDITNVQQPLMEYMDSKTKKQLRAYLCGEDPYTSVLTLKYHRNISDKSNSMKNSTPPTYQGYNG